MSWRGKHASSYIHIHAHMQSWMFNYVFVFFLHQPLPKQKSQSRRSNMHTHTHTHTYTHKEHKRSEQFYMYMGDAMASSSHPKQLSMWPELCGSVFNRAESSGVSAKAIHATVSLLSLDDPSALVPPCTCTVLDCVLQNMPSLISTSALKLSCHSCVGVCASRVQIHVYICMYIFTSVTWSFRKNLNLIYTYIYIYIYIYIYSMSMRMYSTHQGYVCARICLHLYYACPATIKNWMSCLMYAWTYVCMYYVCMLVCVYVYIIHVCTYVLMYGFIFWCTWKCRSKPMHMSI